MVWSIFALYEQVSKPIRCLGGLSNCFTSTTIGVKTRLSPITNSFLGHLCFISANLQPCMFKWPIQLRRNRHLVNAKQKTGRSLCTCHALRAEGERGNFRASGFPLGLSPVKLESRVMGWVTIQPGSESTCVACTSYERGMGHRKCPSAFPVLCPRQADEAVHSCGARMNPLTRRKWTLDSISRTAGRYEKGEKREDYQGKTAARRPPKTLAAPWQPHLLCLWSCNTFFV